MKSKSILYFTFTLLVSMMLVVSCSDDDDDNGANPPSVTAPSSTSITAGGSADLTFTVSVANGYQSASVTSDVGTASITSEPSAGATSGDVVVNVTGTTEGSGVVTLTVTDADGLSDDASTGFTIGAEQTTFTVTDNISSETTWETGNTYILSGRITVLAGATLNIEPGTIIKGEAGTGPNSTALLVARDATINANGEAGLPIIFTSVADEITPEQVAMGDFTSPNLDPDINGLWGGVLILGNAPISVSSGNEAQIEGIPSSDTNGLYGGDDSGDSSGSFTYVSIRHGGTNIGEGNEINGLTLGGVGTGTTIENIEIVANQDDGVEWFGGTVSVNNVLVWNNGDDALDTDQAWAGTVSNVVTVNPAGSSMELDGPEGTFTNSGHTIENVTAFVGNSGGFLIDTDANTDVNVSNVLFFGLPVNEDGTAAIDFDDDYATAFANNTNGYAITSLEVIIPSTYTDSNGDEQTANLGVGDYFPTEIQDEVTEVADLGSATVGADASVFGWTWASQSGALGDLGVE